MPHNQRDAGQIGALYLRQRLEGGMEEAGAWSWWKCPHSEEAHRRRSPESVRVAARRTDQLPPFGDFGGAAIEAWRKCIDGKRRRSNDGQTDLAAVSIQIARRFPAGDFDLRACMRLNSPSLRITR